MKSIIEQASSIMKAIEKAWNQAEQPKEFSIKIFEKEERNFFGMSTKPAKIGIFFGDKPIIHEKPAQKPRPEIKECRPTTPLSHKATDECHKAASFTKSTDKPVEKLVNQPTDKQKPAAQQPTIRPTASSFAKASVSAKATTDTSADTTADKQQPRNNQNTPEKLPTAAQSADKPRRIPAAWNDAMIATTHSWLKNTLELMNMAAITFNSEIAGKNLKLTFNKPLVADAMHEKQLFRSFAHLIMSSLRNQYKQEIKDLKVILIRPE